MEIASARAPGATGFMAYNDLGSQVNFQVGARGADHDFRFHFECFDVQGLDRYGDGAVVPLSVKCEGGVFEIRWDTDDGTKAGATGSAAFEYRVSGWAAEGVGGAEE